MRLHYLLHEKLKVKRPQTESTVFSAFNSLNTVSTKFLSNTGKKQTNNKEHTLYIQYSAFNMRTEQNT